jgi:hypothetical protein
MVVPDAIAETEENEDEGDMTRIHGGGGWATFHCVSTMRKAQDNLCPTEPNSCVRIPQRHENP